MDRIGQQSDKILCYSFLPADGVERIIRLRSRVQQRLRQNSEVVGSDEAFFEGDVQNQAVFDLYNEKSGLLDGDDDTEIDLASYAYQIWKNAIDAGRTKECRLGRYQARKRRKPGNQFAVSDEFRHIEWHGLTEAIPRSAAYHISSRNRHAIWAWFTWFTSSSTADNIFSANIFPLILAEISFALQNAKLKVVAVIFHNHRRPRDGRGQGGKEQPHRGASPLAGRRGGGGLRASDETRVKR